MGMKEMKDAYVATMEAQLSDSFLGVALDARGNLYIADAAAQRIRKLSPDGIVTTIAGTGAVSRTRLWVEGGFADGPARSAKFNTPLGVAVGPDGTVYVADSENHCVRATAHGTVRTFAGNATRPGNDDGPAKRRHILRAAEHRC